MVTPSAVAAIPVPVKLTPAFGRLSYTIRMVPLAAPTAVGKKLTCMVSDAPGLIFVDVPENPVCEKG